MDGVDPTVYVPYRVRVELRRAIDDPARPGRMLDRVEWPADQVTMAPTFVFLRGLRGEGLNIPVEVVRAVEVVVVEPPEDLGRVRERYPHAYDAWEEWAVERLPGLGGSPEGLAALADELGRPPEHLTAKARALGVDSPEQRSTHVPQDPFVDGHYLVHVGAHGRPPPETIDVLARHDVLAQDVYRIGAWGFAAHLSEPTVKRLVADPDVVEVEADSGERLAPHHEMPAEVRVPGYYVVGVRRTSRPRTVAARAGVVPHRVFEIFNWFSADLTDAQVLALRRDPEVLYIEDDAVVTLDD